MDGPNKPNTRYRWMVVLLITVAATLGALAIKRAVNGNADLSGNHRLWQLNLHESTLPVRREGPEPQDPDAYPPITYALFAPLGAMPLWAAATIWYAVNLGCSIYLWNAAREWLHQEFPGSPDSTKTNRSQRTPERILGLAVLGILPAWIGSLLLGQNMLPLMALTWSAMQLARRHRPWLAGGLITIAAAIKVIPAVFLLPFLLARAYRVATAFTVCGLLLIGGLGSAYFGPRTNLDFHLRWLKFAIQGPENRAPDPRDPNTLRGSLRYHNQSIEAVLARLMMDVPIHNREGAPRVNAIAVSAETWRRTRSTLSVLCLILGLMALYREPRPPRVDQVQAQQIAVTAEGTSVETFAILSLLLLFVSPIVWSHYYVWLFWPLLWLLVGIVRGRRGGGVLYLGWLAGMPLMAVPEARAIGVHLWLTILLFVWICWPRLFPPRSVASGEVHSC